jgi:hypothetical protein
MKTKFRKLNIVALMGFFLAIGGLSYAAVEIPERASDSPDTVSQSKREVQEPQKNHDDLAVTEIVPALSSTIALSENLV